MWPNEYIIMINERDKIEGKVDYAQPYIKDIDWKENHEVG